MAASAPATYDVFLCHAHEDKRRVSWLAKVLRRYWIPGKRRRRVFLDEHSLVAGPLTAGIVSALRGSRYLVVCCSDAAARSVWVKREFLYFLRHNRMPLGGGTEAKPTQQRVMFCRVGPSTPDDAVVNAFIARLQRRLARGQRGKTVQHCPDLRTGDAAAAKTAALGLLAPVVGMSEKDDLLVSRKRTLTRLRQLVLVVAAAVLVAWVGCEWWLHTPSGSFWALRKELGHRAQQVRFDYPRVVAPAVAALARLDLWDDAEAVAAIVKGVPFRANILANATSWRPGITPERVLEQMQSLGSEAGAGYPEAWLGAYRITRSAAFLASAKASGGFQEAPTWILALAESGLREEALSALSAAREAAADEFFPLAARTCMTLGLPLAETVPSCASLLEPWLGRLQAQRSLHDAMALLDVAALQGRFRDPTIVALASNTGELSLGILEDGSDPGGEGQSAAAFCALAGRTETARRLLAQTAGILEREPANYLAERLAFRGLAHAKLGEPGLAAKMFDRAVEAAGAHIEATRTWREFQRVALALVLAGYWRRALDLRPHIGSESAQIELELQLVVWWGLLHPR